MEQEHYLFKIIIIGDSGVGKTALVNRYIKDVFQEENELTIGVDYASKIIELNNNTTAKLQIWDTAGQEVFKSITLSYYKNISGAILCYDVNNMNSFISIEKWLNELNDRGPETCVKMLLGIKNDKGKKFREVKTEDAKKFAKDNKLLFGEISNKNPLYRYINNGLTVDETFLNLAKEIHKRVKDKNIPINRKHGVLKHHTHFRNVYVEEDNNHKKKCCN